MHRLDYDWDDDWDEVRIEPDRPKGADFWFFVFEAIAVIVGTGLLLFFIFS